MPVSVIGAIRVCVPFDEVMRRYDEAFGAAARGEPGDHIGSFLSWATDPATELDSAGEEFVDGVLVALAEGMWDSVRDDPTHPLYRAVRRNLATMRREHSTAASQLAGLESSPAQEDMSATKEAVTSFVLEVVQFARDVCFDESQLSARSYVQMEDMAFILGCVDELVAGLSLYRHNYASQAGAHARTVLETVELMELFEVKPDTRDTWREKKPGEVPGQGMRPWEIREATGKSSRNTFYDLLCDSSSHPRNLWARSRLECGPVSSDAIGRKAIPATVSAAGTRDPMLSAVVSIALVFTGALVALRLTLTSLSEASLADNRLRAEVLAKRSVEVLEVCVANADVLGAEGIAEVVNELRLGLDNLDADMDPPGSEA